MSVTLDFSLTILVWILIAFFGILGFFLAKCLFEVCDLIKNAGEILQVCKEEMPGILRELKATLSNLSKFSDNASQSATGIKNILFGTVGVSSILFSLFKKSSDGFLKGLVNGFNMFKR